MLHATALASEAYRAELNRKYEHRGEQEWGASTNSVSVKESVSAGSHGNRNQWGRQCKLSTRGVPRVQQRSTHRPDRRALWLRKGHT